MKPLTRRQQEFLGKLLDLYYQEDAPVRYSMVAEGLGVGNVTAYEMMRLMEKLNLHTILDITQSCDQVWETSYNGFPFVI